jgi:hypothetical protein
LRWLGTGSNWDTSSHDPDGAEQEKPIS